MKSSSQESDTEGWIILLLIILVIRSWALTLEVFLRRQLGSRHIGLEGPLAFLVLLFYATECPGYDLGPLGWFTLAFFGACVLHRFRPLSYFFTGQIDPIHTRYSGRPILWKFVPFLSELAVKRYVEPLFLFALAICLLPWNPPLGFYVLVGSGCLLLTVSMDVGVLQHRVQSMQDMLVEQQVVADEFRRRSP